MSREKQIEEMAKDLCKLGISCEECTMLAHDIGLTRERYCKAMEYAKRAYEKGHRKQEWISVEERLPRYNDTVLVYRPTMGEKILVDKYKGYYNEDTGDWEEGWMNFGQNLIGMDVITHWMPLPEPPKGE